jgi:hypothetical protein
MAHVRYRNVVVYDPKEPPRDVDIEAIEREAGVSLPDEYKRFIRVANGGALEYGCRIRSGGVEQFIEFGGLYSIGGDGRRGDVLIELRNIPKCYWHDQLPARCVPVARTGGESDTLYLDLTDEGYGRVFAFVNGRPAWTGRIQEDGLYELGTDWDAYLDSLSIEPEHAIEAWEASENATEEGLRDVEAWLDSGVPDWRVRFPRAQ